MKPLVWTKGGALKSVVKSCIYIGMFASYLPQVFPEEGKNRLTRQTSSTDIDKGNGKGALKPPRLNIFPFFFQMATW